MSEVVERAIAEHDVEPPSEQRIGIVEVEPKRFEVGVQPPEYFYVFGSAVGERDFALAVGEKPDRSPIPEPTSSTARLKSGS
jgi:hypothetical protein